MARRVGFNDAEAKRAAAPETGKTPFQAEPRAGDRGVRFRQPLPRALLPGQSRPVIWIVISFLGFWLIGWTAGIGFTIATLTRGAEASLFIVAWLGFAIIGWLFGVWILATLVRAVRSVQRAPDSAAPHGWGRSDGAQ